MFNAKAGVVQFVIGQINDIYLADNTIYKDFDELLRMNLIKHGNYQHVYVFKEGFKGIYLEHDKDSDYMNFLKKKLILNLKF